MALFYDFPGFLSFHVLQAYHALNCLSYLVSSWLAKSLQQPLYEDLKFKQSSPYLYSQSFPVTIRCGHLPLWLATTLQSVGCPVADEILSCNEVMSFSTFIMINSYIKTTGKKN